MKNPIEIFLSYAHKDKKLVDDVRRQLIVEERNGRILKWWDRDISAGKNWQKTIHEKLETASIILLFVSPDFIESRYCYEREGQAALHRHETGEAKVIPVILRPCLWDRSPFSKLQALPRDAKPISRWDDLDEACMNVAEGVMLVVDEICADRDSVRDKSNSRIASVHSDPSSAISSDSNYRKIEQLMPDLIEEMRKDLLKHPTAREFVVLNKAWIYNAQNPYLVYYFDEHEDLNGKLQVLNNLGFIRNITYNSVQRFIFEERFVDYLIGAPYSGRLG